MAHSSTPGTRAPQRHSAPQPHRRPSIKFLAAAAAMFAAALIALIVIANATVDTVEPAAPADNTPDPVEISDVDIGGDDLPLLPDDPDDPDPAIGAAAPTVTGHDTRGDTLTLDPASGDGPTLTVIAAHWCADCADLLDDITAWLDTGAAPANLAVHYISSAANVYQDNYPGSRFFDEHTNNRPVLADSATVDAAAAYGTVEYPTIVITNPDGTVTSRFSGPTGIADISRAVTAASGNEPHTEPD